MYYETRNFIERKAHSLTYLLTHIFTHSKYINTHTLTNSLNTHQAITSVTNSSSPNTPTNHPVIRTKIKKCKRFPYKRFNKHNTDIKSMYFV